MMRAYLSQSLAALNSELIAPMYFLAIPFTIITYIKYNFLNNFSYLPFLPIFGDSPELTPPIAPGLQVYGLLLGLDDLSLGVTDLLQDLCELIFPDGQLCLTHSLLIHLLLVLVVDSSERDHFHAESVGRNRLERWVLRRVVEAPRLVSGGQSGLRVMDRVIIHQLWLLVLYKHSIRSY